MTGEASTLAPEIGDNSQENNALDTQIQPNPSTTLTDDLLFKQFVAKVSDQQKIAYNNINNFINEVKALYSTSEAFFDGSQTLNITALLQDAVNINAIDISQHLIDSGIVDDLGDRTFLCLGPNCDPTETGVVYHPSGRVAIDRFFTGWMITLFVFLGIVISAAIILISCYTCSCCYLNRKMFRRHQDLMKAKRAGVAIMNTAMGSVPNDKGQRFGFGPSRNQTINDPYNMTQNHHGPNNGSLIGAPTAMARNCPVGGVS